MVGEERRLIPPHIMQGYMQVFAKGDCVLVAGLVLTMP
jgi:hypothetical protein